MIKLIYVAGPYRADTLYGVKCNIQKAERLAAEVMKLGAYPVCPHTNTSFFEGLQDGQFFLDGTLELMRRCNAVIVVDGWEKSTGTRGEIAEAERLHIPVFYDVQLLKVALESYLK